VPINTVQVYVKTLLNGLAWPIANLPALQCQITPPDPNVEANIPQAYVWPARGRENRNPKNGGTIPRATSDTSPSGLKTQQHRLEVFLVWWGQDDDVDADTLFPGMVDAVMDALRVSADPTPVLTDPWTSRQSYLIDVGEAMDYEITIRAVADQRYNRYDALITCVIHEVFAA
jgi:hypothetical protein